MVFILRRSFCFETTHGKGEESGSLKNSKMFMEILHVIHFLPEQTHELWEKISVCLFYLLLLFSFSFVCL